jgi:head-tail adaptor
MKCQCPTRLKHRVTIERPGTTKDAAGHVNLALDSNWTEVGKRWAAFVTRGGRESRVFDQMQAETSHIIELQSDSVTRTIVPKWRLKMGTRKFNINAAYDVDENRKRVRVEVTEAR